MKRVGFLFPKDMEIESMRQLRERLLNILLLAITIAGGIVYIAAIIQVFRQGITRAIPVYTALYLILVATTFLKRLGYYPRTTILLTLIYIPAMFNLYLNGLNADSGLFFLALIAITFLLVGLWRGVLVLVFSSLSIAVMGTLIVRGVIVPVMSLPQSDPLLWIVGELVFVLASVILILSLNFLVSGLQSQLSHTQGLLVKIQEAKAELEEKERWFAALLQGSTDMIALLDKDGTIRYASPSIERILGYQPDEIIGQKVYDFLHPEDLPAAARAMAPGVPPEEIGPYLELRIHHRDGTWRVVEVVGNESYDDPAVNGTVINCRDITDRKRIEDELRATQQELELLVAQQKHEIDTYSERLAQLIQYSPVVIYGYGYSEPIQQPFISENILQLTGYEASNFMQDTHLWLSLIHPEDRDQANKDFRSLLEQGGHVIRDYRFLHRDGQYRWFREEARRIMEEAHTQLEFVGLVVDITARKQAELNLLESEKINRLLLETTMDSIILVDPNGKILATNEITARRLGSSSAQLKGQCIHDLINTAVTAQRKSKLEEAVHTGKALGFEDFREGRWYLHTLYPIFDEQRNVSQVAIFATDISHRKEMEEELRLQKENLEAEVAARTRELRILSQELIRAQEVERQQVSRELHDEAGQLMVELSLSLDAAYDELPKEQRAIRKRLKVVRELVSRVTKSIRSLARSLRPPALEVAGINTVLDDLCEEYSNFSQVPVSYQGQQIELPDVVSISLYRFVQETLTNVVKHAKASQAEVRLETMDGYVYLTVSDNGKGMDPARPSGGLGLLGIHERAALLGGRVDIQTSRDGTRVKICIPMELNGKVVRGMSSRKGKG